MKKFLKNTKLIIGIVIGLILGGLLLFTIHNTLPNKVQEVLPSAVHVMCDQWQGSGAALTKDIVVTARHVIDGTNYTITLTNGCQVEGIKAISHKDYDIGFIKVDNECISNTCEKHRHKGRWNVFKKHTVNLKPAKFGSVKDCVLGQRVFIIGSPFGKINFNSVTFGRISGLNRNWEGLSRYGEPYGWKIAFTSDAGAHPGNSGGPVFSMDGVVRGLLVGGFSPVLNLSMPSDLFLNDIENIKLMFAFDKYTVAKPKAFVIYDEWSRPIEVEPCVKDYNYED